MDEKKEGEVAEPQFAWLIGCSDRCLDAVRAELEPIRGSFEDLTDVAARLEPKDESCTARRERIEQSIDRFQK